MSEGTPLVNAVTLSAPSDMEEGFIMDASIGATPIKVRIVRMMEPSFALLRPGHTQIDSLSSPTAV